MHPSPERARQNLAKLATERADSLAALSRLIGRNAAYLQQYTTRGSPKRLAEDDRRILAQHFAINERELGARDPWAPPPR